MPIPVRYGWLTAGVLMLSAGCKPAPAPEPTPEPAKATTATAPAKTEAEPAAPPATPAAEPKPAEPKPEPVAEATPAPKPEPVPAKEDLSEEILKLAAPLTQAQIREGWINLFDGTTLFGWTSNRDDINWTVADGILTADSGSIGLLLTSVPFADFELHCEFNAAEGTNSGVFVRTTFDPKDLKADCYEVNITDAQPEGFLTGSIVGHSVATSAIKGSGGWKSLDITAQGKNIVVKLDGAEVLNYTDESETARASGLIGLQKNAGKIEFKNVRLKPLGTKPLMTGTDLSGWREVPTKPDAKTKAEFVVENGAIRVKGGLGFLETEETFGDFILQYDAASHVADVNSGLFFRTQPGTADNPSNGYEVQFNSARNNNNRSEPKDQGTGAIFRRVPARVVASDDFQWTTITLIASGPQVATWVNGYPVVNWKDDRKPDPNPRRGLTVAPGHLSLQGHDPGTDASFRNARISPLP